jgi:ribosomal protein S18 acetylase RimI-like enzyme
MKIRRATINDLEGMIKVTKTSGYPLPQYLLSPERPEQYFKMKASVFVVVEKKEICGYLSLMHNFRDGCELHSIEVKKKFHKKGIGTSLLKMAEKETKKLGKNKLYLIVYQKNFSAISFYSKNKFYVVELIKGHYSGGEHALLMLKDL